MRIKVSVTKGDIKTVFNGLYQHMANCPVAVAVKRAVKEVTGADIFVLAAYDEIIGREILTGKVSGERLFTLDPPRSAERFMRAIDQNKKVKPFNFFLNV